MVRDRRLRWSLLAWFCCLLPHARAALGVPAPCTEEELLLTSDYAIEGTVVGVSCGFPRDSGECTQLPGEPDGYQPLLVADCMARVRVSRSLKGPYASGEDVQIPFLKLVQECVNGIPMVPGAPKKDFRLGAKVRYYNSVECRYWSLLEIEPPAAIRGDANGDGEIDIADPVAILIGLFVDPERFPLSERMDADADGGVSVTDSIYILSFLFRGGPVPPPFGSGASQVDISVIFENEAAEAGYEAEWGFSCLVEAAEQRVLVDAGADAASFTSNADRLGLDLDALSAVLFTHIHDDHIGGRAAVFPRISGLPVYIPQSFPGSFADEIMTAGATPIRVSAPVEIAPGLLSSGELVGSPPEQVLFVSTPKGVVVITGCAHPGIVSIVEMAKEDVEPEVRLVVGGFHLFQKTEAEVLDVIAQFRSLGVRQVAPCHCTGDEAETLFRAEYGADYIEIGAGSRISLRG